MFDNSFPNSILNNNVSSLKDPFMCNGDNFSAVAEKLDININR